MPNQNMQGLAAILAEQGRNGDTMLMHVAPKEVEYLAGFGGITENPVTGLPEAFKFKDLLPFVGSAFLGPAFKAVGFSPGVSNFLATTASTMLGGGSLEKGIMSGLVSSSIGRLGRNLADLGPDAAVDAATGQPVADTGYKFGIFKKPETGTFGSRYSEAFQSPEFNPVQMVKAAGEAGLDNLLEQIQKPSVMLPFTIGAGELGRIKAEEDYARQYQNFLEDQAERRRRIRERTPQILPPSSPYYRPPGMAQGGAVQRKFDGYSFDSFLDFNADALGDFAIEDARLNNLISRLQSSQSQAATQVPSSAPSWYRWSDGTYNRNPESSGIRTPYNELPAEYQQLDSRRPAPQKAEELKQEPAQPEPNWMRVGPEPLQREELLDPLSGLQPVDQFDQNWMRTGPGPATPELISIPVEAPVGPPPLTILNDDGLLVGGTYDRFEPSVEMFNWPDGTRRAYPPPPEISGLAPAPEGPSGPGSLRSQEIPTPPPAIAAPAPAPAPVITEQEIINSLFVPGADVPQSTGINTAALDDLFANLRKTEELQNLALEPGLLQQGFTGTSGVTAPPAGAGIFATPAPVEQPAIDFEVSPEMAAALQQVARPAAITQEEIRAVQENPRVQALQRISDLLKNNEFGAAFDAAMAAERELGGDFVGNIVDANKLRELRGPMTAEEITKFYNEMPQKVFEERYVGPGNEFKKDQAIERNIAALGGQAGYVDPMLGVKKEETLLSKLPIEEMAVLAALAMGATAIPGLMGGAGGGATAGGATAGGAAGGAGALTGVVPTGLVSGTTAAAVAAAGVPLAEITVIASKLALSIPQAAALISSVGLGAAQALAGGTAAPAATTTSVQPSPSDLAEVVVTGTRVPTIPAVIAAPAAAGAVASATQPPPPATQPPAVETPLDEVVVTAKRPPIENLLGLGAFTVPTTTPVTTPTPEIVNGQVTYPENDLEEVVVTGTRPPLDALLGLGAVSVPLTTAVTMPAAPTPIKVPTLLDTLVEKGKGTLTDIATSQLLGALAGGAAGTAGGAGAGGGGGGYAGTGGLGVIPEGQGRRYIGAPEDYRHGFLPEWMFFENLNPPAVDLTTPGSTPGTTPGTPGNRPGDSDVRIEPKAVGGKIKSYSPRGYLDLIQGYNEGGEIEDEEESIEEEVAEYSEAPMTDGSRGLIQLAQAAILGQLPEEQTDDVIQKFIDLHGNKAFRELREKTLESVANGSRKEGMIEGHTGGMDDMVEGVIGSSERVAVSPGEFIIPADVVSMLGDGNSDSGRTKLEQMMSRVRKDKTGSTKQAKPINSAKVLPA